MNKQLSDKLDEMTRFIGALQAAVMEGNRKLETLRVVVDSQSKLVDKLTDRLVEMAMVNQGMGREAAGHRRAQEDTSTPEPEELWDEGCDVLTMP